MRAERTDWSGKWVPGEMGQKTSDAPNEVENKFKRVDRTGSLSRLCGQVVGYWWLSFHQWGAILWDKFLGVVIYAGDRSRVESKVMRLGKARNCGQRHFMGLHRDYETTPVTVRLGWRGECESAAVHAWGRMWGGWLTIMKEKAFRIE